MEMKINIKEMTKKSTEIASILRHLGHPKRLLILCHLIEGPKTVGELSQLCEAGQPQTSQFLKRMELEGLLSSKRDGNFIHYSIHDIRIASLMEQVKLIFC